MDPERPPEHATDAPRLTVVQYGARAPNLTQTQTQKKTPKIQLPLPFPLKPPKGLCAWTPRSSTHTHLPCLGTLWCTRCSTKQRVQIEVSGSRQAGCPSPGGRGGRGWQGPRAGQRCPRRPVTQKLPQPVDTPDLPMPMPYTFSSTTISFTLSFSFSSSSSSSSIFSFGCKFPFLPSLATQSTKELTALSNYCTDSWSSATFFFPF